MPRYGVTTALPPVDVEIFGHRYAAPLGVAPMGGPSLVFPGADQYLAAACQRANVPYTLGMVGGMTVERAAEIAPDVLWFQLYRCSNHEHKIGFDLVKRAQAAGVKVLVLTLDVPVRTTRSREVAVGITSPFKPDLKMMAGIATSPGYLKSLMKNGQPRFANLKPYTKNDADVNAVAHQLQPQRFVVQPINGGVIVHRLVVKERQAPGRGLLAKFDAAVGAAVADGTLPDPQKPSS